MIVLNEEEVKILQKLAPTLKFVEVEGFSIEGQPQHQLIGAKMIEPFTQVPNPQEEAPPPAAQASLPDEKLSEEHDPQND